MRARITCLHVNIVHWPGIENRIVKGGPTHSKITLDSPKLTLDNADLVQIERLLVAAVNGFKFVNYLGQI